MRNRTPGQHRTSLLHRFLVTYLLVLVFPIAVLSLFQFTVYFNLLHRKIVGEKSLSLERSAELIEAQFNQLNRIVLRMGLSREFRPFGFADEPYQAYRLIRTINEFAYDNSFLERVYVVFSGDSYAYSTYYAQRIADFLADNALTDLLLTPDTMATSASAMFSTATHLVITYRYPFGQTRVHYGVVVFFVDHGALRAFFNDPSAHYEIVDPSGRLVYESTPADSRDDSMITVSYQANSGRVFRTLIPQDMVLGELATHRLLYLVIIAVILVGSFPIIYRVSSTHATPIVALKTFVTQITGQTVTEDSGQEDEIQAIHNRIEGYVQRVNPAVRTQLTLDLLNGRIDSVDPTHNGPLEDQLRLNAAFHTVMIIRARTAIDDFLAIAQRIKDLSATPELGHIEEVLSLETLNERQVILIVGFHDRIDPVDVAALVRRNPPYSVAIGCGSRKKTPAQLNAAYLEAQQALEYSVVSGADSVVFFDDMIAPTRIPSFEIINALRRAFEQLDTAMIESVFNEFRDHVRRNTISLFNAKFFYYELLNLAVRIGDKWRFPDAFQVEAITDVGEVLALVDRVADLTMAVHTNESPPDVVRRIQSFIDKNLTDSSLSLKQLEDSFGLSTAHISRVFKKHYAINISKYIAEKRIDRSKELLRNSDIPIKDIVTSIGYFDTSSFIKAFKIHENETPGEYRRRHQEQGPAGKRRITATANGQTP